MDKGRPEGRGVIISPGDTLELSYFVGGLRHGPFIEINTMGEIKMGCRLSGQCHGTVIVAQLDGTAEHFIWKNGDLITVRNSN